MASSKRYKIFHVPPLAFFSHALYRDVALHWRGGALGYLLLLLAVCWIPGTFGLQRSFAIFVDQQAPLLIEQMPAITIADGQAFINEPQPYTIRDPETGDALLVIDTTGTITSLDQTDARALVTARQAMVRKSAIETRSFSFDTVEHYFLDRAKIYGWLATAKAWSGAVLYPVCLLGSYAYRIVQALIYATIGLLLASLCKARLPFEALLRLAVVAITPGILIDTLLAAAGLSLPIAGAWFFLLAIGYLLFGIRAALSKDASSFRFECPGDGPRHGPA